MMRSAVTASPLNDHGAANTPAWPSVTRANRRQGRVGQESATANAYYWRFLEFGTSKAAARPFIRPAWDARRAHALQVMRTRLWERVQARLAGSV